MGTYLGGVIHSHPHRLQSRHRLSHQGLLVQALWHLEWKVVGLAGDLFQVLAPAVTDSNVFQSFVLWGGSAEHAARIKHEASFKSWGSKHASSRHLRTGGRSV